MLRSTLFYFILFMTVVGIAGWVHPVDEKHRRKLKKAGHPMMQGNFVLHLDSLNGTQADPADNITILFDRRNRKNYVWGDRAGKRCILKTIEGFHDDMRVAEGGRNCPYESGIIFRFNATGYFGPGNKFYDRNFAAKFITRVCSNEGFKFKYCQHEDYQRVMLENGRLTWGHDVWFNYHQFLHKHLCICSLKARDEYFDYFTISFYGQCQGVERIDRMAKAPNGCVNGAFQNCTKDVDHLCSGKAHFDAVYEIIYPDDDFFQFRDHETVSDEMMDRIQTKHVKEIWEDWNSNDNNGYHDKPSKRQPVDRLRQLQKLRNDLVNDAKILIEASKMEEAILNENRDGEGS